MLAGFTFPWDIQYTHGDREASCHSVKVVRVLSHGHNLRDYRTLSPVNPKYLRELSQVLRGSLSDREDGVTKPAHTKIAELLVEELNPQLAGEKRDIFDDSKTDTPLLVFR